jgi:hypothetical protein
MRAWLGGALLTLAILTAACGGGSPAQPAPPPPPPAPPPPAPVVATLSGTISRSDTKAPAPGARLDVVEGVNQGVTATADEEGRYRLENLSLGAFTVRVQATGFEAESRPVTLAADQTLDVALRPAPVPPPPPEPGISFGGLVVDGLSARGLSGAVVRIDGLGETTTAEDGTFTFSTSESQEPRTVTITSSSTVERGTRLRVPGPSATVSLIPSSFDLAAFNQMFRGTGALHRWVTAPRLVIQRRALRFTDLTSFSYEATASLMADAEVSGLVADLEWALAQLTDGTFTHFAGVDVEAADEGASVEVSRPGAIVIARYEGLTAGTNFWGYARWSWNGLGELQGAIVKLDRAFEVSGSPFRRSLRAHELGHALGYWHVTLRDSVMQSHARTEPNVFDRDGARIAFQRPTLNRAPDLDPDPFVGNFRALASQLFWAGSH